MFVYLVVFILVCCIRFRSVVMFRNRVVVILKRLIVFGVLNIFSSVMLRYLVIVVESKILVCNC